MSLLDSRDMFYRLNNYNSELKPFSALRFSAVGMGLNRTFPKPTVFFYSRVCSPRWKKRFIFDIMSIVTILCALHNVRLSMPTKGLSMAISEKTTTSRREEIVNACEKLYRTMSFREITLKEISEETSFSRPSIYNYFATKE